MININDKIDSGDILMKSNIKLKDQSYMKNSGRFNQKKFYK